MKSIKLILLATAVLAIASSLAVGTTIQTQGKSVFNSHSHTRIGDEIGEIKGNDGSGLNMDDSHSNRNDNMQQTGPGRLL